MKADKIFDVIAIHRIIVPCKHKYGANMMTPDGMSMVEAVRLKGIAAMDKEYKRLRRIAKKRKPK